MDGIALAERDVRGFDENSVGTIQIICTTNFAGYFVAKYVSDFSKRYKSIRFNVMIESIEEAMPSLERNKTDLVIGILPLEKIQKYALTQVERTFKNVFVASKEYAEENNIGAIISQEKFDELNYIEISPRNYYRKDTQPHMTVATQEIALQLILHGAGIGFGIESYFENHIKNGDLIKFQVPDSSHEKAHLCYAHSDCISKSVSAFMTEFLASVGVHKTL